MSTKNLIDSSSESKRPLVFDDKTGEYRPDPRMELTDALQFVHDAYGKMKAVDNPKVHRYAIQFALQSICKHMGWLPYEIAAAEQYVTMMANAGSAASAG